MKVIITERQRKLLSEDEDREFLVKKKIAKKQLVKRFGDLIPYETNDIPNFFFYIDENKNIYFECNKKNGEVWVDNKTIRSFLKEVFSFNNEQIKQVMKEWLGEHYKLDVTKIIWSANTVHQYVARTLQNK